MAKGLGGRSLHQDGVLVWEFVATDWAGAVVVQPLADARGAEAVLTGQLQDTAAALEVFQADLALLHHLLLPRCMLRKAHALLRMSHRATRPPGTAAVLSTGKLQDIGTLVLQ